jgi:hypothetical protein
MRLLGLELSTDPSNVFVTGNSLGGWEAQVAARANGFGGTSYGGPGVFAIGSAADNPNKFIAYVNDGDPVGNFATENGGIDFTGIPQSTRVQTH